MLFYLCLLAGRVFLSTNLWRRVSFFVLPLFSTVLQEVPCCLRRRSLKPIPCSWKKDNLKNLCTNCKQHRRIIRFELSLLVAFRSSNLCLLSTEEMSFLLSSFLVNTTNTGIAAVRRIIGSHEWKSKFGLWWKLCLVNRDLPNSNSPIFLLVLWFILDFGLYLVIK